MKAVGTRKPLQSPFRTISNDPEVIHVAEFLRNRYYLVTFKRNADRQDTSNAHYLCTDDVLTYQGFYADFGPLNLGMFYRYCLIIVQKLNSKELKNKAVVHYTTIEPRRRANAAFLVGSFAVVYLQMPPRTAWNILCSQKNSKDISYCKLGFLSYRDAQPYTSKETVENTISVYDCIKAIDGAFFHNLVSFDDFTLGHYEAFEVNGYSMLNWIVPSKLLAFCNPSSEAMSPINITKVVRYFVKNSVGVVVRLNEPSYNPSRFSNAGIQHVDLYFDDGTAPSLEILAQFLHLVEHATRAVAVHCRAGLGRTGSLIAAYLMKHYRMTSREAVAWLRICRPGSVISNQQAWLDAMQHKLWESGDVYRIKHNGLHLRFSRHSRGIYSKELTKVTRSSPRKQRSPLKSAP